MSKGGGHRFQLTDPPTMLTWLKSAGGHSQSAASLRYVAANLWFSPAEGSVYLCLRPLLGSWWRSRWSAQRRLCMLTNLRLQHFLTEGPLSQGVCSCPCFQSEMSCTGRWVSVTDLPSVSRHFLPHDYKLVHVSEEWSKDNLSPFRLPTTKRIWSNDVCQWKLKVSWMATG